MILTDIEHKLFLKTHFNFLFFVGQKSKIINDKMDIKKFVETDFSIRLKCREFYLENRTLLDDYLTTNFDKLTTEQISILTSFKKTIASDFTIFKCLTNNAIFIDTKDNKFYAVKALSFSFDYFFDRFSKLVTTSILPFNNQIIYDRFMKSAGIYFGSGIKSSMNENYKIAKRNNQILTTI